MPSTPPTADDIQAGNITFVSLDTQVIQAKNYQLDRGALAQLPGQLPESFHLVLTEVVVAELTNHRSKQAAAEVESIESSLAKLARQTGRDFSGILDSLREMDAAKELSSTFERDICELANRCSGSIIPWATLDPGRLFIDYFREEPPFEEGKKKSEFPDAASLQALEKYATDLNTMGIVVSDDGGWKKYCKGSERLYCLGSLDELAALFVANDDYTNQLSTKIKRSLSNPNSALSAEVREAVEEHVASDSDWDTSDLVPEYSGRLEVEIVSATVNQVDLPETIEVWRSHDDSEPTWIVEVTACVVVALEGSKLLYIWDGVDKEEMLIAAESEELLETLETRIYIRLMDVRLDLEEDQWNISVDIAPATYYLAPREVIFDMR